MDKIKKKQFAQSRKRDPELLYKFSEEGVMRDVDILDQEVEGVSVREIIAELEEKRAALAALQSRVGYHVRSAGVKTLEEVVFINHSKNYVVAELDEESGVLTASPIPEGCVILSGQPIPEFVDLGYHKLEKGEIVEDKVKKLHFYRLM